MVWHKFKLLLSIGFINIFFLVSSNAQLLNKYWVFFNDKGPPISPLEKSSRYKEVVSTLNSRAVIRRRKVLPPENIVGEEDFPLYRPYIDHITSLGAVLVNQSRWLNAASFKLTNEQLEFVKQLPFVKCVRATKAYRKRETENKQEELANYCNVQTLFSYGPSLKQNQMINAIQLHQIGINGYDVLVGMLDTGFRWKFHEALQGRSVIGEYDFIFHDSVTANEVGDAYNQDEHGTVTMSVLGGYREGQLIGPAFNAKFILGKTEDIRSETPIEEDNWVTAIEWMEMNGVDVVSSSLGYNDFDPYGPSEGDYTWTNGDFDGKTTTTARAAVRAARLGVVVCSAMGNEGNGNGVVGTILTPADADSIISVGAINFSRTLASFSSTGPTNDGRNKPDLVAPGVGVYSASTFGPSSYVYKSGTSLSTPLVASAAALLLSAKPELTPIQVRDILRNTADTVDATRFPLIPNNFTGWGLVNAYNAVLSVSPVFSNKPDVTVENNLNVVYINVVSKFGVVPDSVVLYYLVGNSTVFSPLSMTLDSSMFFPTSGRYKVAIPQQLFGTQVQFYIEAVDSALKKYSSPPPFKKSLWVLYYGGTEVDIYKQVPKSFVLKQNYPNPFNSITRIDYDLPQREHVVLKIYNVLGQEVATLVDEIQEAGEANERPPVLFDASCLPSGVYFYRLSTPHYSLTKKMMLIK